MSTIVKLCGTSGSGKSHVAHTLIRKYEWEPLGWKNTRRKGEKAVDDYLIYLPRGVEVVLLGRYQTQCGGCDGIQPYTEILRRVEHYARQANGRHILMEGLLIGGYGSLGRLFDRLEGRGWTVYYALMDTPYATCIRRIQARRDARGDSRPLNTANTEFKYHGLARAQQTLQAMGKSVVSIDHKRPVSSVLKLFDVQLRREP